MLTHPSAVSRFPSEGRAQLPKCQPSDTVFLLSGPSCPSAPKSSLSTMADTTASHKLDPPKSAPSSLSSIGKPVYLELCIKSAPGIERLVEIMFVDGMGQQLINTDVELFASIRKAYKSTKREGLFKIFAFLFRPDDIHFVEFAMLHQRPIIFGAPPIPSLPPPVEADEKRYHYSDYYAERLPMHRDIFCQYYRQRQECVSRSTFFLNRLPKKLGTSMTVLSQKNPREFECGWGIHIIEGPNKAALATLASIFLILDIIFANSYNAYMGTSDPVLAHLLWIAVTLVVVLLAFHFHFEDQ
jgi:hypothetical protein